MAKTHFEYPTELVKRFTALSEQHIDMFEQMTTAGAKVVEEHIRRNAPQAVRESDMMRCLKVTKPYESLNGDKINTKTAFYGYFTNEDGKKTPAPLVANVFEFGRGPNKEQKKPFIRKSFKGADIEQAMLAKQEEIIKQNGWED